MKVDVDANVTVKNHEGVMSFGFVEWVEGQVMQIQADGYLSKGRSCEIRLELTGTNETIYAEADILSVTNSSTPSAVARIRNISDKDRDKLSDWVEELSSPGSASALRSVSVSRYGGASTASVSTVMGRRSGREALRQALRKSVQERRVAPPAPQPQGADPSIVLDDEGRVTITWTEPKALADDIQRQLRQGTFALPFMPDAPQFLMRMVLPDGQILAVPATSSPSAAGCVARFRMGLPLKQKLKRAARGS